MVTKKKIQARPYQSRIINNSVEIFMEGEIRSIMIESPTGSGKSYMGLMTANGVTKEVDNLVIVWVAMRKHLLHQVGAEQEKFELGHLDVRPLSMFDAKGAKVIKEEIGDRPVMIVLDEAHHDAATSMTDIYQALQPEYVLGLSATPFRVDKAKLCFEKQIRDAGIHRLIEEGFLSKFNSYTIDDWKPETVAAHYLAEPEKWGQSVFYFLTQEQCVELYNILQEAGVKVDLVLGGDKELKDKLEDFRAGRTTCLINCMVLTEGFDCPELESAWVRPSGRGPTMQMAGRAYRICETVPRKKIIQSRDTRYPITRCAPPEEQHVWMLQKEWVSVKANKNVHAISIATLKQSLNNWKPLPDYIKKQGKKVKERVAAED